MNRLSIITPVYNTEIYLKECIESVLNQSYTNFEFLIADDGSTDNCKEIIQKYAKQDSRIKPVFLSNNSGNCNYPRHILLKKSTGDFIYYIDSDDTIQSNCLSEFIRIAKYYNTQLIFGNKNKAKPNRPDVEYYDNDLIKQLYFGRNVILINCMVSKHIATQSIFEYNLLFEDMCIAGLYCLNINTAVYVNTPYYYYRCREGSIIHSFKRNTEWHRDACITYLWDKIRQRHGSKYDKDFNSLLNRNTWCMIKKNENGQYYKSYQPNAFLLDKMKQYYFGNTIINE